MWLFNLSFSSLSQRWYVEVWISRSISVSPLEFEISTVLKYQNCFGWEKMHLILTTFFLYILHGPLAGIMYRWIVSYKHLYSYSNWYMTSCIHYFNSFFGGGRVVRRCCVSYITGASSWNWLTVGQGLLSL